MDFQGLVEYWELLYTNQNYAHMETTEVSHAW